MVNMLTSIFDNESIDPVFALQMMNVARGYIEDRQPLMMFKALDSSVTVPSGNNWNVPITLPANFRRYLPTNGEEGGAIQLFNGSNLITSLREVEYEKILSHKGEYGTFCVNYGTKELFILGTVPQALTLYQFFIADYGDITLTTHWGQVSPTKFAMPNKYAPMLVYETAAMWRLGTDYDNTAARNGEDNAKRSDMIYKGLIAFNSELALSNVGKQDYGGGNYNGSPIGIGYGYGPRGYGN